MIINDNGRWSLKVKISSHNHISVIICLLAGLLIFALLGIKFDQYDNAVQQQQIALEAASADKSKQNTYQVAIEQTNDTRRSLLQHAILLSIGYILLVIGVGYRISRTIVKPLEKLAQLTGKQSGFQSKTNLQYDKGVNEVQILTNHFNRLYRQMADNKQETLKSRAAEQSIKDQLRALVNNVSLSIITINTDGSIDNFNPTTPDLFALSEEQLGSINITEILPTLNIYGGLFKQMLNAGVDIELDAIVGNNLKPVELSCAELNYHQGQQSIRQYILILNDISHRKRNEDRMKKLNQKLINTSRQAGIAEIATSILHSVGNVLNSVNTSVSMLQQGLEQNKISGLQKAAEMFKQEGANLFQPHGKGPQLVEYLEAVVSQLDKDKNISLSEVASLKQNVSHIAEIVSAQQKFSGKSGLIENLNVSELIEEALNINVVSLENNQVTVERNYHSPLEIMGDRSKIMQILVNLIRNANEAMMTKTNHPATIEIAADIIEHRITISVKDNGHGIGDENMRKMFRYGFTTKQDGHGFGLHSCALAAKEMHGDLVVESDGVDQGALFKLELPIDPANREAQDIQSLLNSSIEKSHG